MRGNGGRLLLWLALAWLPWHAAAAETSCDNLNIDKSRLVANAVFPVRLAPFGEVCFAAHVIPNPVPDAAPGENAAAIAAEPYFALSLFQNGKDVYDFSAPAELWNTSIDRIVAIAFRKLNHDKFTDVIVIGHSYAANANDIYQPLIFRGNGTGFTLDADLSTGLMQNGYATMPALLQAINSGVRPSL